MLVAFDWLCFRMACISNQRTNKPTHEWRVERTISLLLACSCWLALACLFLLAWETKIKTLKSKHQKTNNQNIKKSKIKNEQIKIQQIKKSKIKNKKIKQLKIKNPKLKKKKQKSKNKNKEIKQSKIKNHFSSAKIFLEQKEQ